MTGETLLAHQQFARLRHHTIHHQWLPIVLPDPSRDGHVLVSLASSSRTEFYQDPKLRILFGADFLTWSKRLEGPHIHRLKVFTSVFLVFIFLWFLKYSLDSPFLIKGLLFGNVASGSLYPSSSLPSSANSGGPGTAVFLAESGWNWQRSKPSFIVIHTYQAWKCLWAPSGCVIFLTLSLWDDGKRLKRQSPQVALNFLGGCTDVG